MWSELEGPVILFMVKTGRRGGRSGGAGQHSVCSLSLGRLETAADEVQVCSPWKPALRDALGKAMKTRQGPNHSCQRELRLGRPSLL